MRRRESLALGRSRSRQTLAQRHTVDGSDAELPNRAVLLTRRARSCFTKLWRFRLRAACTAILIVGGTTLAFGQVRYSLELVNPAAEVSPAEPSISDQSLSLGLAEQAQFQQPMLPGVEADSPVPLPSAALEANRRLFSAAGVGSSPLTTTTADSRITLTSANTVRGAESFVRATTDAGDLLGSSPSVLNLGVQRRNPIVNDPRVRGSRVGQLAASGSYWVPARIDLDTALSKIDSRLVEEIIVIPGPYSSLYGPGFQFLDVALQRAPRSLAGPSATGRTAADFKSNGDRWYGRQDAWGGSHNWGFRAGYGHGTGNDFISGNGTVVPSSYKTRDVYIALGRDWNAYDTTEANYLRLDQTDVELAGQAFDIDVLQTDAVEVEHVMTDLYLADEVTLETWYNRTRFLGSAGRPSKRSQFPFYDFIRFSGTTDVDSLSTGYRSVFRWNGMNDSVLLGGADFRYIEQELNERTSGRLGSDIWTDANSPIPDSYIANPGLFAQWTSPLGAVHTLTTGGRLDYVATDIVDDPVKLATVGVAQLPAEDILGSDQFDQGDLLATAFVSLDRELTTEWTAGASVGFAQQAPNLTERYAIEPFMFLLQNGLNTVTGDPELDKEQVIQLDLRVHYESARARGSIVGYYAWLHDYITLEVIDTVPGPPVGNIQQLSLKYVNTDEATLTGFEAWGEYDLNAWLTAFGLAQYVQGEDLSRNGSFATRQAGPGQASEQVAGAPRGSLATVNANNPLPLGVEEPLSGILPLEARVGVRVSPPGDAPRWGIELLTRIVDNQDRVAQSLFEMPTPGFTVWNIRSYWRPADDIQLTAGVENFTDKQYREHLNFISSDGLAVFRPGVNYYAGAEIQY